jgi:hypothetical protein
MSFFDNSHNDDDEKDRMKRNIAIPRLMSTIEQQHYCIYSYTFNLIIFHIVNSFFHPFFSSFLAITHIHTCVVS